MGVVEKGDRKWMGIGKGRKGKGENGLGGGGVERKGKRKGLESVREGKKEKGWRV